MPAKLIGMKRLLPVLSVVSLALLGGCQTTSIPSSSGISGLVGSNGRVLPPCPGSRNENTWTNCTGTFAYASEGKYVGAWKNGKMHGRGTYIFASGGKYVGELKDGKQDGQGTVTFANGDKYVGEFKDNKFHGYGTYTSADGKVWKGSWKNGEFKGKK